VGDRAGDLRLAHDAEVSMPYIASALRPKSPERATGSISSVRSRSSSTTPGYFASLCGKSDAHTNRSPPASSASSGAVRSPGSKLIQHWRAKYSRGVSDSVGVAQP
jgi:hypothetical protein